ncbi:MAG: DsbA family protein, partial [Hyphomonadaceae bacterium]|nr:DsbA family protein [Hyphomonadaceae bacterium]
EAAAAEGLTYAVDKMARQPNTIDCHRLIKWAGDDGRAPQMKQHLMDLYFTQGADLSDRAALVKAAADCGLDPQAIAARLDTDEDVEAISQDAAAATEAGIQGVPCFILGGIFAVSGAQAPEYLADAIRRAADERARRTSAGA